jgi:3-deoxy-7-phosphoheptulonate synthase
MMYQTDDVRIREIKELAPPAHLMREFAITPEVAELVYETRLAVHDILYGRDDRVFVVVGPCSVHDVQAALEYASRLKPVRARTRDALEIIMRVYFEKPRTTVGWKGLINDPDLDGSFRINKGLRLARKLLLDVNELGVPAATEYLDTISPQYVADLISWGAIGARTPSPRCTASWPAASPVRLASRTARMATSRSLLMRSRPPASHITSSR